jgi:hypothetical protein
VQRIQVMTKLEIRVISQLLLNHNQLTRAQTRRTQDRPRLQIGNSMPIRQNISTEMESIKFFPRLFLVSESSGIRIYIYFLLKNVKRECRISHMFPSLKIQRIQASI